jgi:multidrug transporter EmrE-like cation transporter
VPGPTKQAPPPLRVDTARVVLAGIGIWTAALVVLLVLGDRVDRLWTWTCLAAIALALLGLWIMRLQGQWPRRHSGPDGPDAG